MSETMAIARYHDLESNTNTLHCADGRLVLDTPKIMGVLNLTPDSFFDGGKYNSIDKALRRVEDMISEGADIIDVGAESTRPYTSIVSLGQEIERLVAVLSAIKSRFDILISVDTYKPEVMTEALKLGVHMVNDIFALQQPGALEVIANSQAAICLMHMQGIPDSMQNNPHYSNVVIEVSHFLLSRVKACLDAGIAKNRIIIDPGFGFGKNTKHNLCLLKNLTHIKQMNFPVLVGLSRKSSIGEVLSLPVEERLFGSIGAQVIAAMCGAAIIRTHDIKPTAEANKIVAAVLRQESM
jgi:dihydropteroate synthase